MGNNFLLPSCTRSHESEKKALQNYHYMTCNVIASSDSHWLWFIEQYGQALSLSSISTILKKPYDAYLNENTAGSYQKKRAPAAWHWLVTALYSWQRRMEQKVLATKSNVL